jgi:hypothetical protein
MRARRSCTVSAKLSRRRALQLAHHLAVHPAGGALVHLQEMRALQVRLDRRLVVVQLVQEGSVSREALALSSIAAAKSPTNSDLMWNSTTSASKVPPP